MPVYRIFIVEDDPGLAEGIAQMVRAWGMDARVAGDFRRVAQGVCRVPAAPGGSGHLPALLQRLLLVPGDRKFSKVPLLFLSSAADNMNIVMAMNKGADDFVAKPFDAGVLTAKIQALLRGPTTLPSRVPCSSTAARSWTRATARSATRARAFR